MAYGQNMNAPMSGLMSLAAMKGRMGDNTLVHVNPMELKALDAMAPGGLTKNPTTGLPEAFKIKDILPILGGIAGAALFGPAVAGFLGTGAGVGTGIATGIGTTTGALAKGDSAEEALTQGVFSGLTSGMLTPAAGGGVGQEAIGTLTEETAKELGKKGVEQYGLQAFRTGAEEAAKAGLVETAKFGLQTAGLPALAGGAAAGLTTSPAMFEQDEMVAQYQRPETVTIQQQTPTGTPEQQRADIDRYIRQGGAAPTFFNYSPAQVGYPYTYAEEGGSLSKTPVARGEMFSGMVEDNGNGDGMSDNVEFEVVGDPEIGRAMLSPDEYVMDAYTVAALGNGSADAGADKLDKFREALRKKVYGSKEQPNEIDGAKELSRLA